MRSKISGALVLLAFLIVLALPAQPKDVPLHKIAETKTFKIYKMIHANCEVFVVSAEGFQLSLTKEYPPTVAIATGRGCR